jgi:hypothetical protein
VNGRRRLLLVASAALAAGGCTRVDRVEATVHWLGIDHAFGAGLVLASADGRLATVGFFAEPLKLPALEQLRSGGSVVQALVARKLPCLMLELHFKGPGRAGFDNLERYAVTFGNLGSSPVTFNRQSRDWVKDGSIELAGEALAGKRLLGRVRRAGATDIDGTDRPYRWDLSFDAAVAA